MKAERRIEDLINNRKFRNVMGLDTPEIKHEVGTSLTERKDLILKEWTSKKGVELVLYKNGSRNLQLEKSKVEHYKVLSDGTIEWTCISLNEQDKA